MKASESDKLKANPFVTDTLLIGTYEIDKDFTVLNADKLKDGIYTGEVNKIVLKEKVDSDKCTKIYTKAAYRVNIFSLPTPSKILYLWFIYVLAPGKDYIYLNKKLYMQESGISSINTIKTALSGLIDNKIIALSPVKDHYYINPLYFYSGSRVKKYNL